MARRRVGPECPAPARRVPRPGTPDSTARTPRPAGDRGAAAVEFAILLPLLLLLLFGIIDFGRALFTQVTLTQAAREGARLAALAQPDVAARTAAAASGVDPVTVGVTACAAGAGSGADAVVTATHDFTFVTPLAAIGAMFGGGLDDTLTLTAEGVMPCET